MNPVRFRWYAGGFVAGALCLALAATPSVAQQDDDEDARPRVEKEIRIHSDEDREEKEARGGYLGVRVQDINSELQRARDLSSSEGSLVNRVEPGSPADEAGLRRWDVIVEIDRDRINDSSDLMRKVGDLEPGSRIPVVVVRDGSRRMFEVTLGKRPDDFRMFSERFERRAPGRAGEDVPDRLEMRDVPNMASIQRQLDKIERELSRLRDNDFRRLERQLEQLRERLRERDDREDRARD